jgi:hypothetical protein
MGLEWASPTRGQVKGHEKRAGAGAGPSEEPYGVARQLKANRARSNVGSCRKFDSMPAKSQHRTLWFSKNERAPGRPEALWCGRIPLRGNKGRSPERPFSFASSSPEPATLADEVLSEKSVLGLGRVETPALSARVEKSRSDCAARSQTILRQTDRCRVGELYFPHFGDV